MAYTQEVKLSRTIIGKAAHGSDLIEEITAVCKANGIALGRVEALGAVKKARLGFYDQTKRVYEFHEINKPMEITNLVGNISLKDGQPMVHAHVTLSDEAGAAFGGHLAPGTEVFACEFVIQELQGASLVRGYDEVTGLPLWNED